MDPVDYGGLWPLIGTISVVIKGVILEGPVLVPWAKQPTLVCPQTSVTDVESCGHHKARLMEFVTRSQ